jgi:hypothetical protein
LFFRHAADVGLAEVIDKKAADRDFGADIKEDTENAQHQMTLLPELNRGPAVRILQVGEIGFG